MKWNLMPTNNDLTIILKLIMNVNLKANYKVTQIPYLCPFP